MKNLYTIAFEKVSILYWTIEAESKEKAEKLANDDIYEHGTFIEEDQKESNFMYCKLEEENI